MSGRILFDGGVKSQETEAVEALAVFIGKTIKAGVLDLGAVKLVENSKHSGFYTVTAKDCSCPSRGYRPSQTCKHMRKHFGARDEPAAPISHSMIDTAGFKPVMVEE